MDSVKRQTSTATPAQPGGSLFGLDRTPSGHRWRKRRGAQTLRAAI